ncbi:MULTISPECIES: ABC transporter ATP-binding protein [Prochlorococcus]|uniref:Lipid A export ATP-binding/permease protein MsbA n=1 Tax=Prochlorococcus marinus str. MIT 9116 TaxID=167544 RepID=A0A0A1ZLK3_PROMR|nr:ABC transporter ATP-binding protein [Prochlorococcus marinus]KGF89508.1 Lipid A export ATP-binding/permease protein MsbA [Prochlorococcus marinus str. MIT 9107]KGF90482.1 Lipid A export ATP-binding/permease protein MsbA [Prochlorococcus marinus str. MIT 9116]KGF92961.1 Lipid A export ATP-binding/permease protein MsbA [Prochlorococcus marinus str. MIT 9123]
MLIYVACWPLLAYLAGNLIPAIGSGDLSKVSSIIVKSLFVFLIQKTAQFGQDLFIAKPSLEISEVMRRNLFSKIQKIDMNSIEKISAGDITYRLTEDADRVSEVIYKTAQDTIPCTLQLFAVIIYMFYLDWSLTLSTFVLAPLIILSVNSFGRRVLLASEKSQESTSNLAGLIGESINGMATVRAFAAEHWIENRFYKKLSANKKARYKTLKLLAFQHPVVGFIEAFGILAILGLGAARINLGLLTSEEFSSFFAAILMLIDPISHVSTNFNDFKQAEASIKRLNKINQEPIEDDKENSKRISNIEGKISFRKVNFEYKKDNQILKNINLDIKKGEITAFVGASGAGKSTMMALILKFITPKNGDIFIDDKNLKLLKTKDIRKNIALVQQQPFLFSGRIIDVIRMGRPFTKEEVIESAKTANAHNFIKKLPDKYETKITERGSNFSGGQIQRIAIARAILGNPSVLLLDEATSALDAESESEVQEGLNRAMKNRTVIVIAHRLSTTQEADQIIVFDKGEIIEVGKHIDLLNKKGIYKELCEKQLIKKL